VAVRNAPDVDGRLPTVIPFRFSLKVDHAGAVMTERKLYISNLPPTATEQDLAARFSSWGTVVSAQIVRDGGTGRGKGFGIVEMASVAEALRALHWLNLTNYDGRLMSVNLAGPNKLAAASP
jgi:RNA recognition motif-containing protein